MEPQVTLNVTFKNETQSFLVSDPENTTWADVEAMVKVSFDLNTIQIKYLDEENEGYPSIVKVNMKKHLRWLTLSKEISYRCKSTKGTML